MPKRDRISWNTIISMKDACDEGKGIIEGPWGLFENMCRSGARPSKATFVGLLDACVDAGNRAQAHKAHFCIVESGFDRDPALGNAITNAYGRCRSLGDARGMFDQASKRDSVTWNVMLAALVRNGHGGDAALLYRQMISEGVMPNGPTFLAMFAAVAGLEGLLPIGRGLHSAAMLDSRVSSDIAIRNSIVNMYGRCGDPIAARDAFANMAEHDVVSWNTLLSACAQHHSDAAHLFQEMLSEGILPDEMSFVSMLNACAREECLTEGRRIHARIFRGGQSLHLWNALIDMYHKCNDLETARRIFDEVDRPDCVTWNSIMSALIEEKDCFVLFNDMVQNAVMPDSLTFLTLISACADQAMLGIGKQMHTRILPAELTSISSDAATYTTLVKMYGCCGELVRASRAFEEMLDPNVVSFNSMLSIHAQYGNGEEALALFRNMLEEQVTPDEVTFTCLLSALSHDGRIEAALKLFWRLGRGSERCEDHVNCVIDALGRAGQLEEAERALNASSFLHELLPAMTLLAACKLHKDIDRGNRVIRANLCCHRIGVIAYAKLVNNFDAVGEIVRTINSFIVRDMI
jgi:pentatricopeptide repeat protein